MAEQNFILTRAGYEELQRELAAFKAEYQERLAEFADVNYSANDPTPEEGAYFEARTMKEHVEERIGYIELVLQRADVIDEDPDPNHIDPGDVVTVWNFTEGREEVFPLLGSAELTHARREGISIDSPVGRALLGRRVGDVINVEVPDGHTRYHIRRVEHPV
jgi:transcription elongation factor GreA